MSIDTIPIEVFFIATFIIVVIAIEAGYRLGHAAQRSTWNEKDSVVATKTGALLTLVAFILVFTFGITANRYDLRKELVRKEANIIGTTYLRSDFLPEPHRSETRGLLKHYVDLRVKVIQSHNAENMPNVLLESEHIQTELWEMAVLNARQEMNSEIVALYVGSLNELIVIHSERVNVGWQTRIPGGIWLVLFVLIFFGMIGMGYQTAIVGSTRKSWTTLLMAFSFSLVITLIASLDNPNSSFITVSQQPLVNVWKFMAANP